MGTSAQLQSDPRLDRALAVMTTVKISLDDAGTVLVARVDEALNLIREIDEKLPDLILRFLVTGNRDKLDALHAQRAQAEQDLKDCEEVKPLFERYGRQVDIRRGMIRDGRLSGLPQGEPETWWPGYLTDGGEG